MSVDEQLLRESSGRAGSLREEQRKSQDESSRIDGAGTETPSLREVVRAAKIEREKKEKKEGGAAGAVADAASAPMKRGTSGLLKQAWLNLADSFGLTLIWIDIHVFLSQFFQKIFCKLGEEWLPTYGAGGEAGLAESEASKQASKSIGLVETMGFCLLNLGCLFLIIAIFTIAGMVLKVVENPLEAIAVLLGELWGMLWGK